MTNNDKQNIAIIGGGMLGLALAYRLSDSYNVTLVEAQNQIGGLASAWTIENIVWDKFYHVILQSDNHWRSILSELGLDSQIEWRETKTGFFTDGQFYSMSNSVEFLRFPPLSLIDKFRLGATIFYASKIKNADKLEKRLVENWLKKLSGKKTFEKMWKPLLKAKLGEHYKETSAAFIWATIARMYAARRSGLKKEMFGYYPGGYAKILDAVYHQLLNKGVEILSGAKVETVENSAENKLQIKLANGPIKEFDKVVSTLPSPVNPHICPQLSDKEKALHSNIKILGVVCVSVLLKKSLTPYYVTNITDDRVPFTGVIEMSSLVDKKEFDGKALVYLPKYVAGDDPIFSKTDKEIIDEFISALQVMHPGLSNQDIITAQVARAKQVFALPTLNYSQNLPPIKTSLPGFFTVNSAHIVNGTLNVNETIQLADEAIKIIKNQL